MDIYRLWYLKKNERAQGPFPEALICRYIVLGRIGQGDEVSLDGHYWRKVGNVSELKQAVDRLLQDGMSKDEEWNEERSKALLRWLDDRKTPDPRLKKTEPPPDTVLLQRSGSDRRQNPENIDQLTYREVRGSFEAWIARQNQRYGKAAMGVIVMVLLTILVVTYYQPVNPVKVGLTLEASNCDAPPHQGVKWSNCRKDDELLVGADLRGAELIGASFRRANLSYADLRKANLAQSDLTGAKLAGAQLEDAVWVDGRICAAGSVGRCN